jgi:phage gp16-like protein
MEKRDKSQWEKNLIKKAKTIQNQVLHMPAEEYMDMLLTRYGKSSTADLSLDELKDLSTHLDALVELLRGKPSRSGQKRPSKVAPQARKIWRLWQELHRLGAVRDPDVQALNTFIKRRCRISVESYTWLNTAQATDVIEILKQWTKRVAT